jgi:hypothetical protein
MFKIFYDVFLLSIVELYLNEHFVRHMYQEILDVHRDKF